MAAAKPIYAAQVALYQAYMGLTEAPALFTAVNKDTSELHHELVPFDAAVAQAWLRNSNTALGGAPIALIESVAGLVNVVAYLDHRRAIA